MSQPRNTGRFLCASHWPTWISVLSIVFAVGCDEGSGPAQANVIRVDVPRVREIIREDLERGLVGVRSAATKLARGFAIPDPERRTRDVRTALNLLRQPPRGVPELMVSPISFVAAVGLDGKVIARDGTQEPDPMAGFDAGGQFELVQRALGEGAEGYKLSEFPSTEPNAPPSQTVLYAAPSMRDGQIVGVVFAGTPLWRTAQRLSRQLQAENADDIARGRVSWVFLYRGDELFHHGTPADLQSMIPDAATRASRLAASPGGFTGEFLQYGRWYAYGVAPTPRIGPDVGILVVRAEPTE